MTEIIIEKNVSIPEADENSRKAILEKLEIGDSFSIPLDERRLWASLISSEFHALTDKRFKISNKSQPKGNARIWRLADSEKSEEEK